jgi:hypothetical protein
MSAIHQFSSEAGQAPPHAQGPVDDPLTAGLPTLRGRTA